MKMDHIALKSNDIKETVSWYQENLSADILYQDETWALVQVNCFKIAFVLETMHPPHICFEIDLEKKNELELEHEEFKHHRDGSAYLYVKDINSNVIEFLYWPDNKNAK